MDSMTWVYFGGFTLIGFCFCVIWVRHAFFAWRYLDFKVMMRTFRAVETMPIVFTPNHAQVLETKELARTVHELFLSKTVKHTFRQIRRIRRVNLGTASFYGRAIQQHLQPWSFSPSVLRLFNESVEKVIADVDN